MTTPIWRIFTVTALGGVVIGGVILLANAGVIRVAGNAPDVSDGNASVESAQPGTTAAQEVASAAPAEPAAQSEAGPDRAQPDAVEEAPVVLPSFDVVRIEPDGSAVIAGEAAPGSAVALMLGDTEVSRTEADGSGRFVAFLSLAPSDQPRALSILADPDSDALRSDETVIVSPFAAPSLDFAADVAVASAADPGPAPEPEIPVEVAALDAEPEASPPATPQPRDTVTAPVSDPESVADAPEVRAAEQPVATPQDATVAETIAAADPVETSRAPVPEAAVAEALPQEAAPEGAVADAPAPAPEPEGVIVEAPPPEPEAAPVPEVALADARSLPSELSSTQTMDQPQPDSAPLIASDGPDVPTAPEADADSTVLAAETAEQPAREDPALEVALSADNPGDVATASAPGEPVSADLSAPSVVEPSIADQSIAGLSDPGVGPEADSTVALLAPAAPEGSPSADAASAPVPDAPDVPAALNEVGSDAPVPQPSAPSVFVADSEGVRILQPAGGETAPDVMANVALDTITYDEIGDVVVGGRGSAEGFVRIYLNNQPVKVSRIAEDGQWRTGLPDVDTGVYTLRVDEVSAEGDVISRIETPFRRESPEILAQVMAEETSRAGFNVAVKTVQPGHTLWAIAEERYGDGVLYVRVFEANRDLIRDPNMIFPGQVFRLPQEAQDG